SPCGTGGWVSPLTMHQRCSGRCLWRLIRFGHQSSYCEAAAMLAIAEVVDYCKGSNARLGADLDQASMVGAVATLAVDSPREPGYRGEFARTRRSSATKGASGRRMIALPSV